MKERLWQSGQIVQHVVEITDKLSLEHIFDFCHNSEDVRK